MNVYRYEGAVKQFGAIISDKWIGETTAVSEAKARSNLTYQFKKQTGRTNASKIELPGKLTIVG